MERRRMSSDMISLDGSRRRRSSNMTSLDVAWRRKSSSTVSLDNARPRQLGGVTKTKRTGMATIHHLPVEIHQHIAHYLESDRDVTRYARSCRTIHACINDSLWAKKFSETFDPLPPGATVYDTSSEYRDRMCMASYCISFDDPEESPVHRACGQVLRDLILQSDAHKSTDEQGNTIITGRNLDFIRKFAGGSTQGASNRSIQRVRRGTNILETLCKTLTRVDGFDYTTTSRTPKSFAHIIQLTLLHLIFDPDLCLARPAVVNMSQEVVYRSQVLEPIFKGRRKDRLNIYWLLHVVNHFKFHLKQRMEGILEHFYRGFSKNDLPRAWTGPLKNETTELGRKWKGTAMFLDETETATIRTSPNQFDYAAGVWVDQVCDGNDGFQDLYLFFDIKEHPKLHFPQHIEQYIKGKPQGPLMDCLTNIEYNPEVKDFFGLGYDGEHYHLHGRLHALPPQQGIPGFQRVTMLKYMAYTDRRNGEMLTKIWAYEGLVSPGGTFIVGRWWDLFGQQLRDRQPYCGPFIYWNVECTEKDNANTGIEVALAYIRSLEEKQ